MQAAPPEQAVDRGDGGGAAGSGGGSGGDDGGALGGEGEGNDERGDGGGSGALGGGGGGTLGEGDEQQPRTTPVVAETLSSSAPPTFSTTHRAVVLGLAASPAELTAQPPPAFMPLDQRPKHKRLVPGGPKLHGKNPSSSPATGGGAAKRQRAMLVSPLVAPRTTAPARVSIPRAGRDKRACVAAEALVRIGGDAM